MTKLHELRVKTGKGIRSMLRDIEDKHGVRISPESYYMDEKRGVVRVDKAKVYAEYFGVEIDKII